MTTEELLALLEPTALADKAVDQLGALTSIAVSMKRQADALELIAERLKPQITMREETPEERDQREGWIKWDGGNKPPSFPDGAMVQVRLRGDTLGEEYPAEPASQALHMIWNHSSDGGDIIAYRVT